MLQTAKNRWSLRRRGDRAVRQLPLLQLLLPQLRRDPRPFWQLRGVRDQYCRVRAWVDSEPAVAVPKVAGSVNVNAARLKAQAQDVVERVGVLVLQRGSSLRRFTGRATPTVAGPQSHIGRALAAVKFRHALPAVPAR
jgi:hypothetical protein